MHEQAKRLSPEFQPSKNFMNFRTSANAVLRDANDPDDPALGLRRSRLRTRTARNRNENRLAHRLYQRRGELLVEFAAGAERIDCQTILGFWVRRVWLNAESLPEVRLCLEEVLSVET